MAGDFLGSLGAVFAGLCVVASDADWACAADPLASLLTSAIIFRGTLPLLRTSVEIVMETAPSGLDIDALKRELKRAKGVKSVHSLHVWELSQGRAVCTLHATVDSQAKVNNTLDCIKVRLHAAGLHDSTVQLEVAAGEGFGVGADEEQFCMPCIDAVCVECFDS